MERRDFLRVVATSAGVVATSSVLKACGGWAVNAPAEKPSPPIDGAGRILFARDAYPELQKAGGQVMLKAANGGLILVMRKTEDEYFATSGVCTHARCPVGYVPSSQLIECPCHGAQFGLDGHVIRKPAVSRLNPYPVRVNPDTDELYVDTNGPDVPGFADGKVEFALADVAGLDAPDTFFTWTPSGLDRPIIIVRYETQRFYAADATCTFGSCVLEYSVDRRRLKCPCHGCEFDFDGTVRQGPATKTLRPLATTFDGTTVRVTVPT